MIVPEPENVKAIARKLLDLADRPLSVEYVMWPEVGFRVPEDLAAKFVEAWESEPAAVGTSMTLTSDAEQGVTAGESYAPEPVPAKRKPGRPKKIVEA